ncbi:phosphatidylinositol-specific phospholipase C domain-containing protein [Bacillus cereus]
MKGKISSIFTSLLIGTVIWGFPTCAFAHEHPGYSHDETIENNASNWMGSIEDGTRLSELSIPGTHDTMSQGYGGDIAQTQSLSLETQLNSGIRFLDIRCRYVDGSFAIHHGPAYLHANFTDVLDTATNFLKKNPNETILMRIKQEYSGESDATFNQTLQKYIDKYPGAFFDSKNRSNTNPSLGEMRGKIVILLNVGGGSNIGLQYPGNFKVQDDYNLSTNWDLYDKWVKVRDQLYTANKEHTEGSKDIFINYLSGSGGSFPYFVASGHSSPGTGAPRLATGLTTPGWKDSYPDFPRVDGFLGIYTIAFEGTNVLTTDYLGSKPFTYAGITVADFPGRGLINNVINVNHKFAKITKVSDGDYKIVSALGSNKVLDFDYTTNNHAKLWDYGSVDNQQWELKYNENEKAYQIINKKNPGKILAWNMAASRDSDNNTVFVTENDHKTEHYWILKDAGNGYVFIQNKCNPNMVLDVSDSNLNNGSIIQIYEGNGTDAQKFKFDKLN